jgi:hypothetical protein
MSITHYEKHGSHFIHNGYTKMGNNNTKRLAYTALVRPILDYGAVCWDHKEKVS